MQIAETMSHDILAVQFEHVQSLWTELLLLMGRSAQEDPAEGGESVDLAVERLMGETETAMSEFRRALGLLGGLSTLATPLREQVALFSQELQQGLSVMTLQVSERTKALTEQRDAIRVRLQSVQKKQKGVQGYRSPSELTSQLVDSKA
jgi:hypothetical protein